MRIGILGGTYDPMHVGHLAIAQTAVAALALDQLLIIPSRTPPHKPAPATTPAQRLDMCRLTCADIRQCVVSDIELQRMEIPFQFTAAFTANMHGIAGWFDVEFLGTNKKVVLTTAPGEPTTP